MSERTYDTLIPQSIEIVAGKGVTAKFLLAHLDGPWHQGENPEGAVVIRMIPKMNGPSAPHPLYKLAARFAQELTDEVAKEMFLHPVPVAEPTELATAADIFPELEGEDGS